MRRPPAERRPFRLSYQERRHDHHRHPGRQRRQRRGPARRPRGARPTTPEAAEFQWRATCTWVNGTHSQSTVEAFFGLGERAAATGPTSPSTPTTREIFASEDNGATPVEFVLVGLAGCLTAGVAAVAQHREHPAALGHGHARGRHGRPRHPRRRPRRPQRLQRRSTSSYDIDADATPGRHRGARRPVAEALGGLRRHHQPDQRHRRGQLSRLRRVGRGCHARHRRRHRRRPRRAGHEPPPHRALDRPRGPRARRGGELVAHRALGLAAPAHAQLAHAGCPATRYEGDDPDGFMTMPEVARLHRALRRRRSRAPVRDRHDRDLGAPGGRRRLRGRHRRRRLDAPTRSCWRAGPATSPTVPAARRGACPRGITHAHADEYRNPGQLPDGGVLVVGASATGVQLADEIQRSGRPVTLAVGEHVRMPRALPRPRHPLVDGRRRRPRRAPRRGRRPRRGRAASRRRSWSGSPEATHARPERPHRASASRLVGRLAGDRATGGPQFSGSLATCALADLKLNRLLDRIDAWAAEAGLDAATPPERLRPTAVPAPPRAGARPGSGEIRTIIWATGYRPDYSLARAAGARPHGRLRPRRRRDRFPGLYLMGMPFLRRRKSTLIDGAGPDARELAAHLAGHLDAVARDGRVSTLT